MNPSNRLATSLRRVLLAQLCLMISVPFSIGQTAPAASPAEKEPTPADTTAKKQIEATAVVPPKEETVVLSPFEVVTDTRGYYSANTMSGTRFNTKLDDLASSVTVMTKEEMNDFGMLDINDVFLYVAGTEGTGTYTDYTIDRNGSVSDNVQINPTGANRVRGIGPANVSLDNIETMNRIPLDPITIEGLEISRGPNANVFGLGNPSGTVNMVPAAANLTTNRAEVVARGDSFGGWRTSLDVNSVLLKDKLAVRVSGVHQYDAFQRKPSGVDTERYNAMVKYRPFKNTTITASYNYFHDYGNRPNSLPPRDDLSYWESVGSPTWDPVTETIHINGTSIGPITATNFPATFAGHDVSYFSSGYLGNNHNQMFIDQNGLVYWAAPQSTTNAVGPTANFTAAHYLEATNGPGTGSTGVRTVTQPLFATTPTISDQSVYDWSSINISAPNSFWDTMKTSNVKIDQILLNTPMQSLAVQLAFMREDSQQWTRNLIGIANDLGQSGQLTIDVNERLLDGSPNPFFLRPYIATDKPRTVFAPAKWDTSRAQVAYKLDLTREQNALKWVGLLQLTGYAEYKYRVNRQYSYRDAIASDAPWITAGVFRGNQSAVTGTPTLIPVTQGLYRYYVGDNKGFNVDYAPGNFTYGTYPFVWGNSATGVFHSDNLDLEPVATTDSSGGTSNTKVVLRTKGGVVQDHLWNDRVVVTLGARTDEVLTKFGALAAPSSLNSDGETFNYAYMNSWQPNWTTNGGRTTNVQFVVRPFKDWPALARMDHNEGGGHFLASLLDGFSAYTNRSNSFLPSTPAQALTSDLTIHYLPNPTGSDKSFGFGFNLFDGKVVIRATHYDDIQHDARNGDAGVFPQRVTRIDLSPTGQTPNPARLLFQANAWITWEHPTWTATQVRDEETAETGISPDLENKLVIGNPPFGTTNDIESKGNEIEINYNPTHFWTVSASATDTKAIDENISPSVANWITDRMAIWTTIKDPRIGVPVASGGLVPTAGNTAGLWWNQLYASATSSQTPAQNFLAFVGAPYSIIQQQEGKLNPQVRRYAFRGATNFLLAGITDNKYLKRMSVGGALRWEDKGAIGYWGVQQLPAEITEYDASRPIYDHGHFYVDLNFAYKTKMWRDKIIATFRLNVRNLGQKTGLQPIGAFPDGTISTYRIIDPEQFIFSATFDL